jgi:hypothetical protein
VWPRFGPNRGTGPYRFAPCPELPSFWDIVLRVYPEVCCHACLAIVITGIQPVQRARPSTESQSRGNMKHVWLRLQARMTDGGEQGGQPASCQAMMNRSTNFPMLVKGCKLDSCYGSFLSQNCFTMTALL